MHNIAVMKLISFITCILLIISSGCEKNNDYIPNIYVNIDIDLSLPEYSELNALGNSIFIEGGNAGLIIYHFASNEYKVYDRNCSYQPSLACAYIDSVNSSVAYCGCCTSAFLLHLDGTAANAPALLPLKKYNCILENQILHIFN